MQFKMSISNFSTVQIMLKSILHIYEWLLTEHFLTRAPLCGCFICMKVLLVQKVWAPVTVEFVVVYSDCVSVNMWSHTLWVVYLCIIFSPQINKKKLIRTPAWVTDSVSFNYKSQTRLHWDVWCKTSCAFSLWGKRQLLIWDWLIPQPIRGEGLLSHSQSDAGGFSTCYTNSSRQQSHSQLSN